MANPSQKLADSLETLKALQDAGIVAIRSADLGRTHRERLLRAGFLHEVMKGWYIPARDDQSAGESTGWYTSYWDFCAAYLEHRFGDRWCLAPEHSLALHVGNPHGTATASRPHAAGWQQANESAAQYLTLRCPLQIAGEKKTPWSSTDCGCSHWRRRLSHAAQDCSNTGQRMPERRSP